MFKIIILFLCGLCLGGLIVYIDMNGDQPIDIIAKEHLSYLIQNSSHQISEENWHCENIKKTNIGDLVAHIVTENMNRKVNELYFGCVNEVCSFSFNYCKLWQSDECSQLFIKYDVGRDISPNIDTISCIVIP